MDQRSLVVITAIGNLKPDTWYYGTRCPCARLLALCEDLLRGRGVEELLGPEGILAVRCECGRVSAVMRLHKFKYL